MRIDYKNEDKDVWISIPDLLHFIPWKALMFLGIAFPMLFFFIGAGSLGKHFYRSAYWSDTPAVITFSGTSASQHSTQSRRVNGRTPYETVYSTDIRYTYQYGSETYDGFTHMSDKFGVDHTIDDHPVGKEVSVKVNPEDFSESYLPIFDVRLPAFFMISGTIFALFFGSLFYWGLKKSRVRSKVDEIPGVTS